MLHYTAPVLALAIASALAFESTTIEDAARDFRIQTYDFFRLNRDEYNRRRQVADEATRRFEAADKPRQQELVKWFALSMTATRNGDPLPPLPTGANLATEQLADDAASATTESIAENARQPEPDDSTIDQPLLTDRGSISDVPTEGTPVESASSDEQLSPQERPTSADVAGDGESQETSIVKIDKSGPPPQSRTLSILGSVGRAVTNAVSSGAERETNVVSQGQTSTNSEADLPSDDATPRNPSTTEKDPTNEPTPAELDDESFDVLDEDLELDGLILENPAADDPLEPTPETFQREVRWNQRSTIRFAERVENLEKAIQRVALRLDMPGMTVEQIEGAVELAEDMCWHYKTLATYLSATGGDDSIVNTKEIRVQVARLQERLLKGLSTYRKEAADNPAIGHHIVKLEELILRAQLLQGEVDAAV